MPNNDRLVLQFLRSVDFVEDATLDIAKHFGGIASPRLPNPEDLEDGEMAINFAKDMEIIAIKNDDGEVVYLPFNIAKRILEAESNISDIWQYARDKYEELKTQSNNIYNNLEEYKVITNSEITNIKNDVTNLQNTSQALSGAIDSANERIDEIAHVNLDEIINQINALSAKTDSISVEIVSVSGNLITYINEADNVIIQQINNLSSSTSTSITQLSERIEEVAASIGDLLTNEEMDEVLGGPLPVYVTDIYGHPIVDDDGEFIELL